MNKNLAFYALLVFFVTVVLVYIGQVIKYPVIFIVSALITIMIVVISQLYFPNFVVKLAEFARKRTHIDIQISITFQEVSREVSIKVEPKIEPQVLEKGKSDLEILNDVLGNQ